MWTGRTSSRTKCLKKSKIDRGLYRDNSLVFMNKCDTDVTIKSTYTLIWYSNFKYIPEDKISECYQRAELPHMDQ